MRKNIGTSDRILRLVLGVLLALFALWQGSWMVLAFAIFTFFEALTSWCVAYQLLGKNSCPITPAAKKQKTSEQVDLAGEVIDARRLALAGGTLWGAGMFILTLVSSYTGYASHWLVVIGDLYPGYSISWEGSLIGLVYGFIDAAIGLFLLGGLYNMLREKQKELT